MTEQSFFQKNADNYNALRDRFTDGWSKMRIKDWTIVLECFGRFPYNLCTLKNFSEIILAMQRQRYFEMESIEKTGIAFGNLIALSAAKTPGGTALLAKKLGRLSHFPEWWWSDVASLDTKKIVLPWILKKGTLCDINVALRHPLWWKYVANKTIKLTEVPKKNFRRLMEMLWTVRRACFSFPYPASQIMWENTWLYDVFKIRPFMMDHMISVGKFKEIRYLLWLCPEFYNPMKVLMSPRYKFWEKIAIGRIVIENGVYHRYIPDNAKKHADQPILKIKGHAIKWLETQNPIIFPHFDDVCERVYENLSIDCEPTHGVERGPYYSAKINLSCGIMLYYIFDVPAKGNMAERVFSKGREHPYWNGPYGTFEDERKDFYMFLEIAKEQKWKKMWWPLPMFMKKGDDYYQFLRRPPMDETFCEFWRVFGNMATYLCVFPNDVLEFLEKNAESKFAVPVPKMYKIEVSPVMNKDQIEFWFGDETVFFGDENLTTNKHIAFFTNNVYSNCFRCYNDKLAETQHPEVPRREKVYNMGYAGTKKIIPVLSGCFISYFSVALVCLRDMSVVLEKKKRWDLFFSSMTCSTIRRVYLFACERKNKSALWSPEVWMFGENLVVASKKFFEESAKGKWIVEVDQKIDGGFYILKLMRAPN
jgi:hypothetical protein